MRYGFIITVLCAVLVFNGCKDKEEDQQQAAQTETVIEAPVESSIEPLQVPQIIYQDQETEEDDDQYAIGARIRKQNGEEGFYHLELMLTEAEQQRGMMFREPLPPKHAMMFIFEQPFVNSFWMKNVFYPLDILFVGQDGVIHHIQHNAEPMSEELITANAPSRAIIELNGGEAKEKGLAVGDVVLHNAFTAEK